MKSIICLVLSLLLPSTLGFVVTNNQQQQRQQKETTSLYMSNNNNNNNNNNQENQPTNAINRRSLLTFASKLLPAAAILSTPLLPSLADDTSPKEKIVVFGGSGYVGAHVSQLLSSSQKYNVVSVSRKSPSDQATKISQILGTSIPSNIEYITADVLQDDLSTILSGAKAVVSCVGIAPGGQNQVAGNGQANINIAQAAKAAGVSRFVYISVDSQLASGPAKFLLGDYFKGKAQAEAAVTKGFGSGGLEDSFLVIKPAFIAGGPPGEIRPPGPPGVKPVSVEKVASAVVMGLVGEKSGVVDGNAAIEAL